MFVGAGVGTSGCLRSVESVRTDSITTQIKHALIRYGSILKRVRVQHTNQGIITNTESCLRFRVEVSNLDSIEY